MLQCHDYVISAPNHLSAGLFLFIYFFVIKIELK